MKFIISVVNKDDARPLVDVLVTNGYRVTTLKSAGGFLRKENVRRGDLRARRGAVLKGLVRYSHPGIVGTLTPIML